MLAVVQRHKLGGDEHVLPILLEAYPLDTVGQLHYFLVFYCQAGREALTAAMGGELVGDMLAMLSEVRHRPGPLPPRAVRRRRGPQHRPAAGVVLAQGLGAPPKP